MNRRRGGGGGGGGGGGRELILVQAHKITQTNGHTCTRAHSETHPHEDG
jgi:hypothetical protein